jgi:macrolide-specific efflux system membrane fusion protein
VITDLANLRVTASFSETDAAKITLGMAATLTFDALSGKSVNGKVTYISATSTTSNNVISYPVQVTVDTPDPTIKPGMTATVAVTVDKRDGVLSLPSAAVSGRGTTGTVTIKGPKGNTQVRVQIGLRGDAGVEITSGLTEGQQVVVIPTTSGTSFNATRLGGAGGIGGIGGAVVGGGGPAGGLPRGG